MADRCLNFGQNFAAKFPELNRFVDGSNFCPALIEFDPIWTLAGQHSPNSADVCQIWLSILGLN